MGSPRTAKSAASSPGVSLSFLLVSEIETNLGRACFSYDGEVAVDTEPHQHVISKLARISESVSVCVAHGRTRATAPDTTPDATPDPEHETSRLMLIPRQQYHLRLQGSRQPPSRLSKAAAYNSKACATSSTHLFDLDRTEQRLPFLEVCLLLRLAFSLLFPNCVFCLLLLLQQMGVVHHAVEVQSEAYSDAVLSMVVCVAMGSDCRHLSNPFVEL